jgi:lysylphosphatidylglycerol synthetase-like protein (DUF2156 family)
VQGVPAPEEIHRLPPDTWVSVLTTLVIMLVETTGLATFLLRHDGYRSPARWAVAFGATLVVTLFFAFGAMHANNAMFLHVLWLSLIDVLLLAGAIVAAIVPAATRTTSEQTGADRPAQ